MKVIINSSSDRQKTTGAGFALIELMAIIVTIAAPSFSIKLANQRVKSTAVNIQSTLKEAKAESIIRRQDVTVIDNLSLNTIALTGRNNTLIATYSVKSQSIVSQAISPSSVTQVVFQLNKLISGASTEVVYTICDDSSDSETPKQVVVNKIANISIINAGSC